MQRLLRERRDFSIFARGGDDDGAENFGGVGCDFFEASDAEGGSIDLEAGSTWTPSNYDVHSLCEKHSAVAPSMDVE